MPLNLFIPSLLRVKVASSSQPSAASPHPLHDLLEPLLLTARATSNKYHVELPQILVDGGGAGEVEETMMWFALNYEKADDDDPTRSAQQADGPWVDEKWRSKWLDRMERREYVYHAYDFSFWSECRLFSIVPECRFKYSFISSNSHSLVNLQYPNPIYLSRSPRPLRSGNALAVLNLRLH